MDHMLAPETTITFAGRRFILHGAFQTLKALEQAFRQDVLQMRVRVSFMGVSDVARLIAVAANASTDGLNISDDEIGQLLLDDVGLDSDAYKILKAELMTWLTVATAPKQDRVKKKAELDEFLDQMRALSKSDSNGGITKASPSESSAGSPPSSGAATSGS